MKRVNILMKHEIKNALINFNISYKIDKATQINGDINSLVQVLNNLISNSIQAYKDPAGKDINAIISLSEGNEETDERIFNKQRSEIKRKRRIHKLGKYLLSFNFLNKYY